jgi:hemoglobin
VKKEIQNRADVFLLVKQFYAKVRNDEMLGPIFNNAIDDWPTHLERLTDFWESNIFFVAKFKGNPILKHRLVDAQNQYNIEPLHFGVWLRHWFATIDTYFYGERATLAKNRARNMSNLLYVKMHEVSPKDHK